MVLRITWNHQRADLHYKACDLIIKYLDVKYTQYGWFSKNSQVLIKASVTWNSSSIIM